MCIRDSLLFYSRLQGDVNPLAHCLLEAFGSLSGVLDASPADLAKVPGDVYKRQTLTATLKDFPINVPVRLSLHCAPNGTISKG